ncbi:MAG: NosD domain-containing protein [Candidatus Thermoplasmatota archaeon]|nr:NosD domain-containing protein [Candidatus Thermoplasmatota archaeon]
MRKILLFIFILIIALPVLSGNYTPSGKTIYVDDDNTNGPWDGSIEHPFQNIAEGIQASDAGDMVFVNSGTYAENIIIDRAISLIGEENDRPIIDGKINRDVILVTSSNVQIQGFCITQDDSNQNAGIKINSDNCYISRNIIDTCTKGIYLNNSFYCDLKNNTITSCLIGIYLFASHSNMIKNNTISDSATGIYIEESSKNIVIYNNIQENSRGVFSSYATENSIKENTFLSNEESAKATKYLSPGFLKPNTWNNNYWDDWIGFGVKVIPVLIYIPINEDPIGYFFPWFEIDWNPSNHPFDNGCAK